MTKNAKHAGLAKLQLGMPATALEQALGGSWSPPGKADTGHVWLLGPVIGLGPSRPFMARITTQGTIGTLSYYRDFPNDVSIDGLSIGMPLDDVRKKHPSLLHNTKESSEKYGIEAHQTATSAGDTLVVMIKDGVVLSLRYERSGSDYPGVVPPKAYPKPDGISAYDLEMLPRAVDRLAPDNHGWVFGLPPGITPEQWPLDPISGYPLMHGFTIKLPEHYRVHGPEIVALSFFATASDHNDGGARTRDELYAAITNANAPPPDNRYLWPFWKQAKAQHPRLHRMSDLLDYEYAVILLTQAEFNGPLCQPPGLSTNPYLDVSEEPQWMSVGSGYAYFSDSGALSPAAGLVEEQFSYKALGSVPEQRLDWNRAIACTPRAQDPNAGIPPEEVYDSPSERGYQSFHYYEGDNSGAESYREHDWAKNHMPNHIGGTMRPVQATPEFSPYYIGFEEYFGGYNFGFGNAQLDYLEMKFDWACG
jgi:hypothetical protein